VPGASDVCTDDDAAAAASGADVSLAAGTLETASRRVPAPIHPGKRPSSGFVVKNLPSKIFKNRA